MNEILKKYIEQYDAKSKERDALLAKGADITQEDIEKVKAFNTELSALKEQIKGVEQTMRDTEGLKSFLEDPILKMNMGTAGQHGAAQVLGFGGGAGTTVIDKTTKGTETYDEGEGLLTEKQLKAISSREYYFAYRNFLRGNGNIDKLDAIDRKTLTEGIDSEGGFLVPVQVLNRLIQKEPAPTRVNGLVERIPASGNSLEIPRVIYADDDIYTTGMRVTFTGEKPSTSTEHRVTDPVFGSTRVEIGTWMMSIPITNDFIEDSAVPIMGWLTRKFGETVDLLFDNMILNGTGVGARPHGIFKNPGGTDEPAVVLSSTANDIDAAQIRGLPFDVPEQYINDNTRWVFNRASTGKKVATMRAGGSSSTDGPFLFLDGQTFPGLMGRTPDTLAGYPITYSAFCANIGDGAYPGVFGDLKGYALVPRVGFSIRVLDELYAETNQKVLLGRLRFGGKVIEPFRMKIMKSDNA